MGNTGSFELVLSDAERVDQTMLSSAFDILADAGFRPDEDFSVMSLNCEENSGPMSLNSAGALLTRNGGHATL